MTFIKGHTIRNTGKTQFKKGYIVTEERRKKQSKKMLKNWKENEYIEKMSEDNSNSWKGEDVGYNGLHKWVIKHLGTPDTCEHCNKTGLKGRQIHWANKDHTYKRNLEDWIRLCVSCHKLYDFKEDNIKRDIKGKFLKK
jgi:hypothetical protein